MSEPMADPIPVTLIAGYLGAGKTTWLNAHLRDGVTPGTLVMVNDFGTINVDAELIDYAGERLLKLSSGCLCCSLSDELGTQLSRIGRWSDPPAALIIETSGVARPRRIADMIRVARCFRLARTVTLVDLASLGQRLADARVADLVADQIRSADLLCTNRGERLDADARQRQADRLRALNSTALLETGPSLPTQETSEPPPAPDRGTSASTSNRCPTWQHRPTRARAHGNEPDWQRFAIDLPASLSRSALEAILADHAVGLARAKGFLKADGRHYVFQWSGGRAEWTPTTLRPGAGTLVGIGFKGDAFAALVQALAALG
ncbi:CobW family GTP-binding protein [Salinicola acroporae]|uniref:CobW C-terminal domain-containing protein n=1 Tax=Salinicola acroporae TaxID=1541440 RepID=A0ABT6IAD9_9GAMM|nr:CobW family GTP-binding protein [Salinicola acroporae]MDH4574334.1 hypothetical protein [Salinicola acroporae]